MTEPILYGLEPLCPRVAEVTPTDAYELLLTFDNGEQRIFDAKPLLSVKAFEPLKSIELFKRVRIAYGSVLWPGEIDYCPDTLYAESALMKSQEAM